MPDTSIERANPETLDLIRMALGGEGTPTEKAALVKELLNLQQSMERFNWEREERQSRIDFDDALKGCQERIGRIAPNRTRESSIVWADYAELDRVIRPIYTQAGFSIAYSEAPELREGKVLICATLSRSGLNRQFFQSVTPAGNPKMNAADMEASGQSRAQRYLLLKIFNVAVGIDADERKPFEDTAPILLKIAEAKDTAELNKLTFEAIREVKGEPDAVQKIGRAKNKRLSELGEAQ